VAATVIFLVVPQAAVRVAKKIKSEINFNSFVTGILQLPPKLDPDIWEYEYGAKYIEAMFVGQEKRTTICCGPYSIFLFKHADYLFSIHPRDLLT
jgi:hypothetical protein